MVPSNRHQATLVCNTVDPGSPDSCLAALRMHSRATSSPEANSDTANAEIGVPGHLITQSVR